MYMYLYIYRAVSGLKLERECVGGYVGQLYKVHYLERFSACGPFHSRGVLWQFVYYYSLIVCWSTTIIKYYKRYMCLSFTVIS